MSSARSATYTVNLNNAQAMRGLLDLEGNALRADKAFEQLRSTAMGVGAAFGVAFAGHELVRFASNVVQTAADYEVSMMRIKNASANTAEGIKNQQFILGEVDKYKIGLLEATDAYGNFLVKVGNSGLAGDKVRELHDNILAIAKVTGSTSLQMNNAVYDIGKMLGEGVLEARGTRQLERVFPQITQFLAHRLGLTRVELSRLESTGKLTKAGVDSNVLLDAVNDYANTIRDKLPEATGTMQSSMNEIGASFDKFKVELADRLKPEIIEFFDTMRNGVQWLRENKEGIIEIGGAVLHLTELWVGYKVSVGAINLVTAAYRGITTLATGVTEMQTSAFASEAIAVNALAAAIERLNYVQNAQNGSFITTPSGITMANTVGNRYALTAGESISATAGVVGAEEAAVGSIAAGAGGVVAIIAGIATVAYGAYKAWQSLTETFTDAENKKHGNDPSYFEGAKADFGNRLSSDVKMLRGSKNENFEIQEDLRRFGYDEQLKIIQDRLYRNRKTLPKGITVTSVMEDFAKDFNSLHTFVDYVKGGSYDTNHRFFEFLDAYGLKSPDKKGSPIKGLTPEAVTHIKGNTVTTINVHIDKQVEKIIFQGVSDMVDFKKHIPEIQDVVVRLLTDAVNDAQQIKK